VAARRSERVIERFISAELYHKRGRRGAELGQPVVQTLDGFPFDF